MNIISIILLSLILLFIVPISLYCCVSLFNLFDNWLTYELMNIDFRYDK